MKKVLIATTALIAAGMVSTGVQAADKIKLELGGFSKWFVVGAWQSKSYQQAVGASFNNVDVKGQSDINFSGSTTLDNGLKVGVFTALRAGTNTGAQNGRGDETNLIDRAYLHVASAYGKIIVGVADNAANLLQVQAPESIGQWSDNGLLTRGDIFQAPPGAFGINGNGINSTAIMPGWRNTGGQINGYKAEGITYLTPTFYGLTLGGSYIPNTAKNVRGPVNTNESIKDIFAVGGNYSNSFGDVGVKASFGWARAMYGQGYIDASFQQSGQEVNFINTGLNLSYAGFTLGGSFRWNLHDIRHGGMQGNDAFTGRSHNGHAWDAGLMYANGPWAASLSYFGSRTAMESRTNWGKPEEITLIQASTRYTLGPGVELQGLVGYGDYKASTSGRNPVRQDYQKNKGWTAMTGVAVQF